MLNKQFLSHYSEILSLQFSFQQEGILVADSGGTKTDWCLTTNNQHYFFSTESYHPTTLAQASKVELLHFWKELTTKLSIHCHFFGAGCSSKENQTKIQTHFTKDATFNKFEVDSDLVAAGIALLAKNDGYVGILGTGSVLTYYQNKKITEIIGGFGYLLGDEGSGYYFGKLVLQKYLNNEMTVALKNLFEVKYGERSKVMETCYSSEGKSFISSIQLNSENESIQKEINQIHFENIELFLTSYLPEKPTNKEISLVGSYAYYQQEILTIALEKVDWKLKAVIRKPIEALATFVTSNSR